MKRFILWVIAAVFCCFTMASQTVGVAVLTHGNDKTMFYGNSALQEAVKAATDGDVITLSPGYFEAYPGGPYNDTYFSKSGLTIIGSGMEYGPSQTKITTFAIDAQKSPEKFIKLTLKNIHIEEVFSANGGDVNYDLSLEKCSVGTYFYCNGNKDNSCTINMVNCINESYSIHPGHTYYDMINNFTLTAYNCVINPQLEGDVNLSRVLKNCICFRTPLKTGSLNNCIIFYGGDAPLGSGIRATNCKAIGGQSNYFGLQSLTNESLPSDFEAFIEGSFYELKPELASTWVDEHGSQIGIYGGPVPFSPIPNAPRFTKFNIPAQTDADGKLPVEIEVAMPEQ